MVIQSKANMFRWLTYAFRVFLWMAILGPIIWGFSTSLKPANKIMQFPPQLIPDEFTIAHYELIFKTGIHYYMINSIIISAATVLLCLALGSMAAYALARFPFRGHKLFMYLIVSVMSIPLASLMVPTYTFMATIGLINTHLGLVLLYTAYQLPMVIWLLKGYFNTIPSEMEKAAMVDGYTRVQAMRKILLPLSAPGLVAAGLFILTFTWNDFVIAMVMNSTDFVKTLPVAIYNYLGFFGREWGPLTASSIVAIIPIIILFIVFQKFFMSGMTRGSIKG